LASDYLLMNGISAFINSPIHADGELQGVLCIERVGPHSAWTSVQRLFAHGVASLVSLALLQHQLLSREEELRDAHSLRHALFNGARDAILISDAQTGHILDANPEAERLFGRTLQQLLGVLQSDLYAGRRAANCAISAARSPAPATATCCAAKCSPTTAG
jgi:GAF domain-containing protein